jgi:hypothetical protein
MKTKIIIALLLTIVALGFRLFLALRYPNDWPGDAKIYSLMAKNIIERNIYSSDSEEPFQPTYFRVPGYPLFLVAIYQKFGADNNRAVRIIQAILDTISCWLVALLALYWSPNSWAVEKRRRAMLIALAFAASCPFTAVYVTVLLTEVWAMLLILACTFAATVALKTQKRARAFSSWLVAGLFAGAATMFRPDAGMFAAGVGFSLSLIGLSQTFLQWRIRKTDASSLHADASFLQTAASEPQAHESSADESSTSKIQTNELAIGKAFDSSSPWRKLALTIISGVIFSFGFALVLTPWTIRNARIFGVFQPIAPASASMPGEFVAVGYNAWLRSWVDSEFYTQTVDWPLDERHITIEQMPDYAFDSAEQKAKVAALLDLYNNPQVKTNNATPAQTNDKNLNAESKAAGKNDSKNKSKTTTAQSPNQSPKSPIEKSSANKDASQNQEVVADDDSGDEDATGDEDSSDDDDDDQEEPAIVKMTAEIDAGFAQIANERKANHPFRYYFITPFKRARYLWFTTHSQYYPFSGEMYYKTFDKDTHQEFWLPLFTALTWFYTILGFAGLFVLWKHTETRRWLVLLAFLILPRFIYLATLQNPEPRYVVEFFPLVLAVSALAIATVKIKRKGESVS